jgi:hypothetical protein
MFLRRDGVGESRVMSLRHITTPQSHHSNLLEKEIIKNKINKKS